MDEKQILLNLSIECLKLSIGQNTSKPKALAIITSIASTYKVNLRIMPKNEYLIPSLIEVLENKTGYKNNLNKLFNAINKL